MKKGHSRSIHQNVEEDHAEGTKKAPAVVLLVETLDLEFEVVHGVRTPKVLLHQRPQLGVDPVGALLMQDRHHLFRGLTGWGAWPEVKVLLHDVQRIAGLVVRKASGWAEHCHCIRCSLWPIRIYGVGACHVSPHIRLVFAGRIVAPFLKQGSADGQAAAQVIVAPKRAHPIQRGRCAPHPGAGFRPRSQKTTSANGCQAPADQFLFFSLPLAIAKRRRESSPGAASRAAEKHLPPDPHVSRVHRSSLPQRLRQSSFGAGDSGAADPSAGGVGRRSFAIRRWSRRVTR